MPAYQGTSPKKRKTKAYDFQEFGVWQESKYVESQYAMFLYSWPRGMTVAVVMLQKTLK